MECDDAEQQKGDTTRKIGVLANCTSKPIWIIISCYPKYGKMWSFALKWHPTAWVSHSASDTELVFK